MEIRVLKYFLAVANEENMTKAAESLHMTQPTLSRQIMQLEKELNVVLFHRGKKPLLLTEEGRLLYRHAEDILSLVEKTEKEFLALDDVFAGEVFIGGGETSAMHFISEVIRDFQQTYPNVKYHFYSGNAEDISEKLDNGLIDIGLLMEPVDLDRYDFIRLKHKERWGLLVPRDSVLAKQSYIQPQDLIGLPLLAPRRAIVQKEFSSWSGYIYDQFNIIATYNLIFNAAIMVEEGIGYAFCLDNLVNIKDSSKVCFVPFQPALEVGVVIVWKKHQVLSPVTHHFLERIKHALTE